jgi:hypothetical protein
MTRPVRAIHQKDVLPAIAVVVEKSATCAQSLGEKLAAKRAAIVLEMNAGRSGYIDEAERRT